MNKKKLSLGETINQASQTGGLEGLSSTTFKVVDEFEEEKLTSFLQVKVKPSEKEKFLQLIGRRSASAEIRKMILTFIKENDDK
tara:strand:+ start:2737 stop:2988 length:252 start_codon:yes stop_codon:yes gene_type:complete